MSILDDIKRSLERLYSLALDPRALQHPTHGKMLAERASWIRKEKQLMAHVLAGAVPIRVDVDDDAMLETAWEFGCDLMGIDRTPTASGFSVAERIALPYQRCLMYGPGMDAGGRMRWAMCVAHIDESGNDGPPKTIAAVSMFSESRSTWMVDTVNFWDDGGGLVVSSPGELYLMAPDDNDALQSTSHRATEMLNAFVAVYGLLAMKHAIKDEVHPSEKLNKARQKAGKEPLTTTLVVKIDPRYAIKSGTGTHASPRPHWRRGHVRRMSSGKIVPVQPHLVMGDAPLPAGMVVKP